MNAVGNSDRITGLYLSDPECRIVRLALSMLFRACRDKADYMAAEEVHKIAARIPERNGTWSPGEHDE